MNSDIVGLGLFAQLIKMLIIGHLLNEEQGLFIAETQEHRLLIERALLEQNQHIHNTLNEAGIACIRALGAQRGLLRRFSDGSIGAGRVDWLEASTSKAVYPIIASSIPSEHTSVEVAVTAATIALAKKTYASPSTIVFFSRKGRAGIYKDGTHLIASSINDVNSDEVHDLDALREVVQAGINVMLTSIKGLLGPNTIAGTRITA